MKISLQQLHVLAKRSGTIEGLQDVSDILDQISALEQIESIHISGQVSKTDAHLYGLEIKQSASATFRCSRCLELFDTVLESHWTAILSDQEAFSSSEIDHILNLEDGVVDLTPWIREELLLQIPYVPVCQKDCLGLCLACGNNRNNQLCECRVQKIDPRWAKLQDLS